MLRRPLKGESEEDLLREQKLFERERRRQDFVPAAVLKKTENNGKNLTKPSKENVRGDLTFHFPVDIVERDVSAFVSVEAPTVSIANILTASLDKTLEPIDSTKRGKRESLFAKRHKAQKQDSVMLNQYKKPSQSGNSYIVTGNGLTESIDAELEVKRIHEENVKKLSAMSVEEIEAARKEILAGIKPETLQFLAEKRKVQQKVESKDEVVTPMEEDIKANDELLPISLQEVNNQKWLHMDVVEKDKLEWTKPVTGEESSDHSICPNARFGFDGLLMPVDQDVDVKLGLHHHGDEPNKAGYTINEILLLMQSRYPSQKIIALQTLSKIMERNYCGYYDLTFNVPLEKALFEDTEVVLIVRKCLDDESDTVIAAAIRCMRSLICNTLIEEVYIDRLETIDILLDLQLLPELKPVKLKQSDMERLKDDEFVKRDVVGCLLRTDLLQRLRYVLEFHAKFHEDKFITENSLDILIRLARHSTEARKSILLCPYLMEVISKLLPEDVSSVSTFAPSKALKLLRIILIEDNRGSVPVQIMEKLLKILQIYCAFDLLDAETVMNEVLHLLSETLKCWSLILRHCMMPAVVDLFTDLLPLLAERLRTCIKLRPDTQNTFEWVYLSNLVRVLLFLPARHNFHNYACDTLKNNVLTWMGEAKNMDDEPHFDILMAFSVSLLYVAQHHSDKAQTELVSFFAKSIAWQEKLLCNIFDVSPFLAVLTVDVSQSTRDAVCLPSYKVLRLSCDNSLGKTLKSVCTVSLFYTHLTVVKNSVPELTELLSLPALVKYIEAINLRFVPQELNFVESLEANILAEYALLSASCYSKTPAYYRLALHLLSCVNSAELQLRLIDFIFDHRSHSLLFPMETSQLLKTEEIIVQFSKLRTFYREIIPLSSKLWVYEPVVLLFRTNNNDPEIVTSFLFFARIVASFHWDYLSKITSLTTHFALISTVFLLSSDIFFHENIKPLLDWHLNFFISKNLQLTSSTETLPHVSNLDSFFEMFLKHFEAVSYGHVSYTNFLLLFLQQDADVLFRKKFLTDNIFAMRNVIVPFEGLALPVERFLYPLESDPEVLELYVKCLLSQAITPRINKLLYLIAVHHLHNALFASATFKERSPEVFHRLTLSLEKTKLEQLRQHILKYEK